MRSNRSLFCRPWSYLCNEEVNVPLENYQNWIWPNFDGYGPEKRIWMEDGCISPTLQNTTFFSFAMPLWLCVFPSVLLRIFCFCRDQSPPSPSSSGTSTPISHSCPCIFGIKLVLGHKRQTKDETPVLYQWRHFCHSSPSAVPPHFCVPSPLLYGRLCCANYILVVGRKYKWPLFENKKCRGKRKNWNNWNGEEMTNIQSRVEGYRNDEFLDKESNRSQKGIEITDYKTAGRRWRKE